MHRYHRPRGRRWQWAVGLVSLAAAAPAQIVAENLSPEQAAILEQLLDDVVEVRALAARGPIVCRVMPLAELQAILVDHLGEEFPRERLEGFSIAAQALGLLPVGHDFLGGLHALLAEQIGGLYDDETKRLCIMEWINLRSQTARIILAHELTHALQDQHYDLLSSPLHTRGNDDAVLAALAVIEGDATVAMAEWAARRVNFGFLFEAIQFGGLSQEALVTAPPFVSGQLLFPYLRGQTFVMQVYTRHGRAAVDALFTGWPESTEQLLHPERSAALGVADSPTPVVVDAAAWGIPAAWQRRDSNVWGEFTITQMLPGAAGAAAAAGWDGDRWEVWRHPGTGASAFLWTSVWDSERDAAEFEAAIVPLLETGPAGRITDPAGRLAFRVPRVVHGRDGATVHLALGDVEEGLGLRIPSAEPPSSDGI